MKNATSPISKLATKTLQKAGMIWFLAAAIGQSAFIGFIALYYGKRTALGQFSHWNDKPIIKGYVPHDDLGNLMFIAHVLLAAIITFGGIIQLIPYLRQRLAWLHRWNGRLYMLLAYFMAGGGIWLTWVRNTRLSNISAVAITLNAILIIVCVTLAWKQAMNRKIDSHRQWAMRSFMLVSGVWFLRVAIMAWVILNGGQRGMDGKLSGPADIGLVFGCYIVPLVFLELYFMAQRSKNSVFKALVATSIFIMTLILAVGIFGAIAFMWGPYF